MIEKIKQMNGYNLLSTRAIHGLEQILSHQDIDLSTITFSRILKFRNIGYVTGHEIYTFLHGLLTVPENEIKHVVCAFCGKPYPQNSRNKKTCSQQCKDFYTIQVRINFMCKKYNKEISYFKNKIK